MFKQQGSFRLIGLITDFGSRGQHYVGAMKAVIKSIDKHISVIDINNNISPFSITEASFIIYYAVRDLPENSIILCVVDPGVGTERKILAVETENNILVIGPDNGIFSLLCVKYKIRRIFEITNKDLYYKSGKAISSTFHGKDIMAPVAAHIAAGCEIGLVGKSIRINDLIIDNKIGHAEVIDSNLIGAVILYQDEFGNLVTNIEEKDIEDCLSRYKNITLEGSNNSIRVVEKFSDLDKDEIGLLKGSSELMELTMKNKSAAHELGLDPSSKIQLKFH
ncbi:MAG: hypothetical protein GF364_03715 [Candidatus Lokiarchaeota archaeon]|nr:hypothetical protein [Candidatus Lokiarchaeota archaeon]